jgi:hypothetical protein
MISNFKVVPRKSPGRTEDNHKKTCEYSQSQGQDLNPGPPEYKARLLTTRPRRSVSALRIWKDMISNFKVVPRNSPGRTEDNHKKPVSIASLRAKI